MMAALSRKNGYCKNVNIIPESLQPLFGLTQKLFVPSRFTVPSPITTAL
jgi:hypothetical protein